MSDISVRPIGATQTHALRQAILRPTQTAAEMAWPGDDHQDGLHAGAFDGQRLIGIATIFPDPHPLGEVPGAWRLRGMAVLAEYRGQSVGQLLLEACLAHARQRGGHVVWCNARSGVLSFYERNDFVARGDEFEVPHAGPHYVMERPL